MKKIMDTEIVITKAMLERCQNIEMSAFIRFQEVDPEAAKAIQQNRKKTRQYLRGAEGTWSGVDYHDGKIYPGSIYRLDPDTTPDPDFEDLPVYLDGSVYRFNLHTGDIVEKKLIYEAICYKQFVGYVYPENSGNSVYRDLIRGTPTHVRFNCQ